jgi:hypothetical protein
MIPYKLQGTLWKDRPGCTCTPYEIRDTRQRWLDYEYSRAPWGTRAFAGRTIQAASCKYHLPLPWRDLDLILVFIFIQALVYSNTVLVLVSESPRAILNILILIVQVLILRDLDSQIHPSIHPSIRFIFQFEVPQFRFPLEFDLFLFLEIEYWILNIEYWILNSFVLIL